MTIYTNDMKSYGMRNGVADSLACPASKCAWSGWTVHNHTAARRPTTLASKRHSWHKEIGRPVRVQWMRNEETAWDTKGPALPSRFAAAWMRKGTCGARLYELAPQTTITSDTTSTTPC